MTSQAELAAGQRLRREWRVQHHPKPPTFELEVREVIELVRGGVYYEELGRSVRRWVSLSEWDQWATLAKLEGPNV